MKRNIFLKTTIILLFGNFITKSLGFIIRIIYTRLIGSEGISLLMIAMPTYSLLVSIASLGLPLAISKLVSEKKHPSLVILTSALPLIIIINFIIIIIMFFFSPFIADKLLHIKTIKDLLFCMSLVLPFISISSLIKGYFFGKQNMAPYALSNSIEQIIRLILILFILPKLLEISINAALCGLILLNIVSEISSIIVFMFFLPNKAKIAKKDLKIDLNTTKEVWQICLPSTASKLIGNIGYFFEPIILTNIMMYVGYSSNYILTEYGIFNAYTIQLLLAPSFFIAAISTSLVPELAKYHSLRKQDMVRKRLNQALKYSLIIGIILNLLVTVFIKEILRIVYNTNLGINYYYMLVPFFILFYVEAPLASALQALNKAKLAMNITLTGVIIKLMTMAVLSFLRIGIYSLIIAEIINIIFVVTTSYIFVNKALKKSFTN